MSLTRPIESLETRRQLSAALVGDTLTIVGAAKNNVIVVTEDAGTVNVYENGKKTYSNPSAWSDRLSITTGSGNDSITLDGLIAIEGGSVYTGGGNDAVVMDEVRINGDFKVSTEDGNDLVALTDSRFEGGALETGNGNDSVLAYGNTFWNYGTIQTGAGNDVVAMAKTSIFGFTTIDLGDGRDLFVGIDNEFASGVSIVGAETKIIV